MFGGIGMNKALCPSCHHQEKTSAHSLTGTCIKCGEQTITINGKIQTPKPNASRKTWRDWIDWLIPEVRYDAFKEGGYHHGTRVGPDAYEERRQALRALLINCLSRKKRK
jgi:hypothetical protein